MLSSNSPIQQQGILWKRRDIFKQKWRPRFFVLEEATLTYYILSRQDAASSSTISVAPPRRSNTTMTGNSSVHSALTVNTNMMSDASVGTIDLHQSPRRQQSAPMQVHPSQPQNPVDYDVNSRGVIYLEGCTVSANDALTRPEEGLFALKIVPPEGASDNECHLAARTAEARAQWVQALTAACGGASGRIGETTSDPLRATADGDDEEASSWQSLNSPAALFENVPEPLAAKLEQSLETYLELSDATGPEHKWKPIDILSPGNDTSTSNGTTNVSAFQRTDRQGRTMLKTAATLPNHPKQVLHLLMDSSRRPEYEPNVALGERLEVLNPFTVLDYYAYKSVWPTSPRDFAVVMHWQVLHRRRRRRGRDQAIALVAFSCPEADRLKESTADHVRASLHISFTLLQLAMDDNNKPSCHMTRLVSYDLSGSLPRNLNTTVLLQQAKFPLIIHKYLRDREPSPLDRLVKNVSLGDNSTLLMTNDCVVRDVIEHLIVERDDSVLVQSARRRLSTDQSTNEKVQGMGAAGTDRSVPTGEEVESTSSLVQTALVLLTPLILYRTQLPTIVLAVHRAVIFCLAAFVAVRYVVMSSLGTGVSRLQQYPRKVLCQNGPTTCRFTVDLKRVVRFIAAKKEASRGKLDISVVHIVSIALARAMRNHADCWNFRRISLPWCMVDGYFHYPDPSFDISVASGAASSSSGLGRLVTMANFDYDNIQQAADGLAASERQAQHDHSFGDSWFSWITQLVSSIVMTNAESHPHGHSLIMLSHSDSEGASQSSGNVDVDITPAGLPEGVDVLVLVGGVRLERSSVPPASSPRRSQPPKPVLSMSITLKTPTLWDVAKCHAFAAEVRKLVQFPELCDD